MRENMAKNFAAVECAGLPSGGQTIATPHIQIKRHSGSGVKPLPFVSFEKSE